MSIIFLLPPDVEELVVGYLSLSYANVGVEMPPSAPLPFILVHCLSGPDDYVTEYACVSIHVFVNAIGLPVGAAMTAASTLARQVHYSMKNLTAMVPVKMSNGSYVSIDHLCVKEFPHFEDYDSKEVRRYCARYDIDLRCNLTS